MRSYMRHGQIVDLTRPSFPWIQRLYTKYQWKILRQQSLTTLIVVGLDQYRSRRNEFTKRFRRPLSKPPPPSISQSKNPKPSILPNQPSDDTHQKELIRSKKLEIVKATEELLTTIAESNWDAYTKRCDPSLSCFEPESLGNLVTGMNFHRFYFDHAPYGLSKQQAQRGNIHTSILNPHVILLGEFAAVIAYIRMTQYIDVNGVVKSCQCEETRVWQYHMGERIWKCVHFHRSSTN